MTDPVKHQMAKILRDILQEECIEKLEGRPGRRHSTTADIVGIRRVAGDYRIALSVLHFHPIDQDSWANETVGSRDATPVDGLRFPSGTIDGMRFFRMKMAIEISINLTRTRENPEEADLVIQTVISRVRFVIKKNVKRLEGVSDDFGVVTYAATVVGDAEYDSGAEDANTSRCWLKISVMCTFK